MHAMLFTYWIRVLSFVNLEVLSEFLRRRTYTSYLWVIASRSGTRSMLYKISYEIIAGHYKQTLIG